MTDTRNYDAVVVGAGVNGLVAATYLAKAGLRVLVAEARNKLGGHCETAAIAEGFNAPLSAHTLYALDPELLEELKLGKEGLVFAVRDMPLIIPGAGTAPIVLGRDMRAAAQSIAPYSQADAKAYPEYRQQLFSLARRMRTLWWNDGQLNLRANDSRVLDKLRRWSVFAWLDSWFETNALKAALAFDATVASPLEPGSALALLWRASQEMCGLQGAVAAPKGGPGALVQAIAAAAQTAGVEIRTGVPVTRIHIQGDSVSGVELAPGDMISAPIVISSLPARRTILELADGANLDIAARWRFDGPLGGTSAAKVLFAANGLPPRLATLGQGRIVLADGMEGLAAARGWAREGSLPDDLAMELVIPTLADPTLAPPGQHIVSVLVRPVPPAAAAWSKLKTPLVERTVLAIERVAPGFAKYISTFKLVTPADMETFYGTSTCEAVSTDRMLLPWKARVGTGTKGLYLCGASAEPMDAISGRAGRITAAMALMGRKP